MMKSSSGRLLLSIAIALFVLGCALSAGGEPPDSTAEPPAVQQTVQPIAASPDDFPTAAELPGEGQTAGPTTPLPETPPTSVIPQATLPPALPEQRRLTVEFPPEIRAGDSDLVRLTLEVDDLGNITPTAQIGDNTVSGEVVEIPNLYETHHVVAEAQFDIAGMEVRPPDVASQPLAQGESITFFWSVRPPEPGVYRGTIWLHLRFIDKQSGAESRKTISAQIVEIEAADMLGLSGNLARTTGAVGSVVGAILGFPFFEDIVKYLFRRKTR
jgi:hypothetical protein